MLRLPLRGTGRGQGRCRSPEDVDLRVDLRAAPALSPPRSAEKLLWCAFVPLRSVCLFSADYGMEGEHADYLFVFSRNFNDYAESSSFSMETHIDGMHINLFQGIESVAHKNSELVGKTENSR